MLGMEARKAQSLDEIAAKCYRRVTVFSCVIDGVQMIFITVREVYEKHHAKVKCVF